MTAVWPRAVAFALMMPIGGLAPRLVVGASLGWALSVLAPVAAQIGSIAIIGELAVGALMGILAALPLHAGRAISPSGPESLAFAGKVWSLAAFFALGGPVLMLSGLAQSFPLTTDSIASSGARFFSAVLLLGLPFWCVDLVIGPIAGVMQRFGSPGAGQAVLLSRTLMATAALALFVPVIFDLLADQWLPLLVAVP